jgi:CxxC-x17-CxxC domain-containing protein
MSFADRSLSCRECGNAFVWTAGEQEFYQQKGLLHDIVCSNCGQAGQVPFAPRTDRPVYCSTCFEARRGATQAQLST